MYDETKLKGVGARIRNLRAEQELTQFELAEKIGVSQTHLSNIERGRVQISLKLLLRIANVLERRLDYFLGLPSLPFAAAAYTAEELGALLQMLQLLKTTNH
ncbi:MAG: helix-turn-helix transcriptional regulator [Acidaminococcaceae bacterium]|nr:helix-turn-helix transcriptional regulator [Acidaminococcaceae bacterium]